MSPPPPCPPSPKEALKIHQRLLDPDDLPASNDLAVAFLEPLRAWLAKTHGGVDPEIRDEAAEEAILALIRNPRSYHPEQLGLEEYLRMSAQGDLRNILRKERKHHQKRVPWESVELSPEAGKYLGREDDPTLRLRIAEEVEENAGTVPESVRQGLSEAETRVLELLLQKERRTARYAEALGILHLSPEEQEREVKRVKDRLKKRLERAGGES